MANQLDVLKKSIEEIKQIKKEACPVEYGVSCKCGWTGKHTELVKNGSVTHGDEWWECPSCGGDSSKRTTKWGS